MTRRYIERVSSKASPATVSLTFVVCAVILVTGALQTQYGGFTLHVALIGAAAALFALMCGMTVRYGTSCFEYEITEELLIIRRIVPGRDAVLAEIPLDKIIGYFPMKDPARKRFHATKTINACATIYGRYGRGKLLFWRDGNTVKRLWFEPSAPFTRALL